ncbi:hypothetical protein LSCM1_04449 [Leishmania martiniquensis]|uniref:Uncharacterized protein n=1 Tax=Leishmania martiniquensis TaxID=1580590 RepID=A0A836HBT1_9TRYP|nr:hypothetical protein LSCM1_04449 [Leishmania martiniquensis]
MVGRRAGGGGRGGAVSAAKRSAARGGKISRRANATAAAASEPASESLSALVQRGRHHRCGTVSAASATSSGGAVEDDVTLVYRRPRTRHAKQSISTDGREQAASLVDCNGGGVKTLAADSTAAVSSPEKEVLAFWQRACGDDNRTRALSNCGVADVVVPSANSSGASSLSQEQIFRCSEDRMETAWRALLNLKDLLYTPAHTRAAVGAPCAGYPCWVRPEQYAVVVALARVCEAALPMQLPTMMRLSSCPATVCQQSGMCAGGSRNALSDRTPLLWTLPVAAAGAAATGASAGLSGAAIATVQGIHESTINLVPSPVLLADVQRRLRWLRRLHQLQVAYDKLIPAFRAASSVTELRKAFFVHDATVCQTLGRMYQAWRDARYRATFAADSLECRHRLLQSSAEVDAALSCFLGNPLILDTLLPFVGITARYQQEEALLRCIVAALQDMTAVETASWGPMASMASWRCTDGLYVVHHASRVHVLRRLLNEAQFYGLPLFLRSIRAMAGSHVGSGFVLATREGEWQRATVLERVQSLYADQFFLTPDCLDPDLFSQPDSMQAQLVQEELVMLQCAHCAFGLVVGEVDEVLTLAHQHMRHMSSTWQQRAKQEEEESPPAPQSEVKAEPLDDGDRADADGAAIEASVEFSGDRSGAKAAGPGPAPPRPRASVDPLRRYVLRTVDAARRHQRHKTPSSALSTASSLPFSHVQWIEHGSANRWSPNAHYYGLSYMVVLETEEEWAKEDGGRVAAEGLLPETAIAVDAPSNTAALPEAPAYCVNALLELWRT